MLLAGGYIYRVNFFYLNIVVNESEECAIDRRAAQTCLLEHGYVSAIWSGHVPRVIVWEMCMSRQDGTG